MISFFDSARSSVAVCGQARKLAMSVAENMLLDDSIPQRDRAAAEIWLPGGVRFGWGVSEVQAAFVTTPMLVYGNHDDRAL